MIVTLSSRAPGKHRAGRRTKRSGLITDNDGTPTVAIAATDAVGAEQGSDPIFFTITRTGNAFTAPVVNLTWTGTATFGTDYTVSVTGGTLSANGLQLTLTAGVTSATVTVTPIDDAASEATETVILTIVYRHGLATVGSPANATGSIADNDGPAVVAVSATDASGAEQGSDPITFAVTRTVNPNTQIVVSTSPGPARRRTGRTTRSARAAARSRQTARR